MLLVTDGFFASNGPAARFVELLEQADFGVRLFTDNQPDPTDQNERDGMLAFQESEAEAIVALGGGSPIDAAKAIAILTGNPSR